MSPVVRVAWEGDREQLAGLRAALWPESSTEDHAKELLGILERKTFGTMPLIELVAEEPNLPPQPKAIARRCEKR